MIFKFETDDYIEAKRLTKATDMALFIYQLVLGDCHRDEEISKEKILELLDNYHINIDDILE